LATFNAVWVPDYTNTVAISACVGTMAAAGVTGAIVVGKRRLFRIEAMATPASAAPVPAVVRFTMGNSGGTTSPVPTSSSPFVVGNQETVFDSSEAYDEINLANLSADNNGAQVAYTVLLLSKF